MASACPTPFASMLDKTSGRRSFKPSKLRWQCESMICIALHGKRRSAAADCAAQFDFDLVFDFQAVFVFCECQPHPFGFGGSTRRINPGDLGRQEQFGKLRISTASRISSPMENTSSVCTNRPPCSKTAYRSCTADSCLSAATTSFLPEYFVRLT